MFLHEFTEYESYSLPYEPRLQPIINLLREYYKSKIEVVRDDYEWKIKSKGFVGYIPLTPDFALKINPKVPIKNLLGMLEYSEKPNKLFSFFTQTVEFNTLEDFYNTIAKILAQKIIDRTKQGLYCTYLPHSQSLNYLRGKVDLKKAIQTPWDVKLNCHYSEQTRDVTENQILVWTLYCISQTGLCNQQVHSLIRQAYHALQGCVTLQPFTGKDCLNRQYNRLNEDYRSLHLLCRFFLDRISPTHELGTHYSYPFLIDMERLYEQFVAQWLRENLPKRYRLDIQKAKYFGQLKLQPDIVLYDLSIERAICVLDTKYKRIDDSQPKNSDVYQVVTYAVSQKCEQAVLVYPSFLDTSFDVSIENIRVSCLSFSLDNDLEMTGQRFLQDLLSFIDRI